MKLGFSQAAALCILAFGLSAQASPTKYAVGQVWEYHTRPQDAGSLLKIQEITTLRDRKVYHVSVVGVHFARPGIAGVLPHAPVSEETLDASVTKLSSSSVAFPPLSSVDEGIAEWQRAQGGVFTIPVSEIIEFADKQISEANLDTRN
jgi:hypothetical protein